MDNIETSIISITAMDRPELIQKLLGMKCEFPIDFSREFLEAMSVEHLRHVVLDASFYETRAFHE